ncbi:MAG TPA: patatin-like phospholipase family protein [Candidatus Binataceae bacterium]|nr:patatin-like phospholipase family protein [Candidatus Binataceae bacterium]
MNEMTAVLASRASAIDNFSVKLGRLALFKDFLPREIDALEAELEWLGLPRGWVLFREGEQDDSLFVVITGRLGVVTADLGGRETIISHIAPGETVGEMALLSGAPRSATVVAMRDSELVRLKKGSFELLAQRHPGIMRFITGLLVQRLERTSHHTVARSSCSAVAIIPLTRNVDAAAFTRTLVGELIALGLRASFIDRADTRRMTEWFAHAEETNDLVLYLADYDPSEWTRMCMRQADRILLLAAAESRPEAELPSLSVIPTVARIEQFEIVFIHGSSKSRAVGIEEIVSRYCVGFQYHVRLGHKDDLGRIARLISGHAIGLVFSGGGARGFAHIGVMKAFNAAGIPIDLLGGTSMGSMIAAAAALEWDEAETIERLKRAFVTTNPLSDYTLPLVAVVRGRKVSRLLREHFGDLLIEDCWRPFFCTSSNLTLGQAKIHRVGTLWRAIRASIAIPGVLPPMIENNQILIDGGVINNLPVDVMSAMRRGKVVGVDVARDHVLTADAGDLEERSLWQLLTAKRRGTPNIIGLLMSAGTINSAAQVKQQRHQVDVLIEPRLHNMGMLDWKSWESAIESGYRQTMEMLAHSRDRLVSRLVDGQPIS